MDASQSPFADMSEQQPGNMYSQFDGDSLSQQYMPLANMGAGPGQVQLSSRQAVNGARREWDNDVTDKTQVR